MTKSVNLSKSKLEDSVDFKSSEKNSKTVRKFSVNLADDCEMVGTPTVTSEGSTYEADPSNPLSVIATQIDEKSGKFAIVIAGGLKKDSSQISGGSGSGDNKLGFAGIGNYVIGCDRKNIYAEKESPFTGVVDSTKHYQVVCPADSVHTLKNLKDALLSAGSVATGKQNSFGQLITRQNIYQDISPNTSTCPDCGSPFYYRKMTFQCNATAEMLLSEWKDLNKSKSDIKILWNDFITRTTTHEKKHRFGYQTIFLNKMNEIDIKISSCSKADKSRYEELVNDEIWDALKYKKSSKFSLDFAYGVMNYDLSVDNFHNTEELKWKANHNYYTFEGTNAPLGE